ncbi:MULTISPECIES: acyltransferase family protein [Klebsiella pneumoniae complex]|uniref:acyltransferase family protein n=1 Tax=Klebsiella pneumoniae complex TaxID=3390273 RepID=UPI002E18052A|nr:acyltransferase [Klebsiella pneumoniae]
MILRKTVKIRDYLIELENKMKGRLVSQIITKGNNNLDFIRLLASLSVIVYHSFVLNPQWGIVDPVKNTFGYVTTGGLAVKIFFFISGLLVTNSLLTRKSIPQFIISRVLRVFPGLAFVVIITAFAIGPIFTNIPVIEYFKSNQPILYVLKNITLETQYFLPGVFERNKYGVNGSLWTIRYEVLAYITLVFLYLIGLGKKRWLSSLLCFIVIVEPFMPYKGILFASSDNNAIYLLAPCFALGSLLAINKNHYRTNAYIPALLFISQFAFESEAVSSLLMCLSVCLIILHISSIQTIIKIKINHDISYGVYLWGFPIQQIISQNFNVNFALNIITSIVIIVPIALCSWFFVEKPSLKLSKKISEMKPKCNLIKSIRK